MTDEKLYDVYNVECVPHIQKLVLGIVFSLLYFLYLKSGHISYTTADPDVAKQINNG